MTKLYAPSNNALTQDWAAEFYYFNGAHYPRGFYRQKLGWNGHNGKDYAAWPDNNAYAAGDGVVTWADWGKSHPWISEGGIVTMIDHGSFYTVYAHLNDNNMVKVGQRVKAGQVVGKIGGTGMVSGPHLHFEVIPKNPNMGNGWYGRSKPVLASSKPATVSAASGATIKPIKEDTLSAAEVKEIKEYIDAQHKKLQQSVREDIAGIVRRHVTRAPITANVKDAKGKEQDITLATQLRWLDQMARENRSILRALAKRTGMTEEQITAAVREAMAEVVEVNVTVQGKDK